MRKPRLIGSERCGLERDYCRYGYEDDGDQRLAHGGLSFAHWAWIHITRGSVDGGLRGCERRSGVYRLAAHHGELHPYRRDLLRRNLENVAIEHNEIGELADLERPHLLLGVQLVCGAAGDRADGRRQRESGVRAQPPGILRARRGVILARHGYLEREPLIE